MLSKNMNFLESFYLPNGVKRCIINMENEISGDWLHKRRISVINNYWLKSYNFLGNPKHGYRWLPLKLRNCGIPSGDFIPVPKNMDSYRKAKELIYNLRSHKHIYKFTKKFNLSRDFIEKNREYLFGYFLGVFIGDADKRRDKTGSRLVDLVLSKKYKSNIRFGDFFSLATNSLGIKMDRVKDKPTKFRWRSESSLLFSYIFENLIGMKEGKLTTYDAVNMDWIRKASRDLKLGFIQGICDSDGVKIHLPGRYIRIACYPNSILIRDIIVGLLGFEEGIKIREIPKMGKMVKIVWMRNTPKIRKFLELPLFNPYVNSHRYKLLRAFVEAERFQKIDKETKKEIREKIKKDLYNGRGAQEIAEGILFGYKVRFNSDVINTVRSKLW